VSEENDPRVLFAAERTLLAWQRSSLSLMGFGFLIERFGLFLRAIHPEAVVPRQHLFALIIGVVFILLGVAAAFLSSAGYRRFIRTMPVAMSQGFATQLSHVINYAIAIIGLALASYLVLSSQGAL
jgi:putative membrane protein